MSRLELITSLAMLGAFLGFLAGGFCFVLAFPPSMTSQWFGNKQDLAAVGGLIVGALAGSILAQVLWRHRKND
jgi:membrane associated rhomboid family serine protease